MTFFLRVCGSLAVFALFSGVCAMEAAAAPLRTDAFVSCLAVPTITKAQTFASEDGTLIPPAVVHASLDEYLEFLPQERNAAASRASKRGLQQVPRRTHLPR